LVPYSEEFFQDSLTFSNEIEKKFTRFNILLDDRNIKFSQKLKNSKLIGSPLIILFGNNFMKENKIEVIERKGNVKKTFSKEEFYDYLNEIKF
jgi:prolyl-tRNA synthetase